MHLTGKNDQRSMLLNVSYDLAKSKGQFDIISNFLLLVACGITVLCGGRKSDKLEFAYELMDDDKDGKLSRQGLWRYLRAFLTVLVTLSSSRNVMKEERTLSAVDSGASWACSQAFGSDSNVRLICFDEFAAWYTNGGYSIIPWLELLDLRKWVIVS